MTTTDPFEKLSVPAVPVPTGADVGSLKDLFSRMYSSYSDDPLNQNTLTWSIPTGKSAYLRVIGETAYLYMQIGPPEDGVNFTTQFNLVNNYDVDPEDGTKPLIADDAHTIPNLKDWMNTQLNSYLGTSNPVMGSSSLSALAVPEGFYQSPTPVPVATSINYLLFRVLGMCVNLLRADMDNFFIHLGIISIEPSETQRDMWLDWIGSFYGIRRLSYIYNGTQIQETDVNYKIRFSRTLAQARENNVALSGLLSQVFGVSTVFTIDRFRSRATLYMFGSVSHPFLVRPTVLSMAPAGVVFTGFALPPGAVLTGALAGSFGAGTLPAGTSGDIIGVS